jgi:hypothetical protein
MAVFSSNAMLQAQFPSPEIRTALQTSIEDKLLADIDDPRFTLIVVRNVTSQEQDGQGEIISFAKWAHPIAKVGDPAETPWKWPLGTNLELVESWEKKTSETRLKVLEETLCYRS